METTPVDPREDRIPLPDPTAARMGVRRVIRAGIVVLAVCIGFTVNGIALLRTGEIYGLPFAVGGPLIQVVAIILVVTVLRARAGGDGHSLSRSRLASASRDLGWLRWMVLVALVTLVVYAMARLALGDPWTLLTSAIVAVFLWLIHRGVGRLIQGLRQQQTG